MPPPLWKGCNFCTYMDFKSISQNVRKFPLLNSASQVPDFLHYFPFQLSASFFMTSHRPHIDGHQGRAVCIQLEHPAVVLSLAICLGPAV